MEADNSAPLDIVRLTELMQITRGSPDIKIGLIDGPVAMGHPYLEAGSIKEVQSKGASCSNASSQACLHGTFIAGMLSGKRGSPAPSICPGCTLLVRPIFAEASGGEMPRATPESLAEAISDCVDAGALVVNLSVAVDHSSPKGERGLIESLNYAARDGTMIVSASGNQGTISCSVITGHPWTVPVAACDSRGVPIAQSNLGISIGRRGLMAPGEGITSLGPGGGTVTLAGTSFAAPFVTGAAALLWSEYPDASSAEVRSAVVNVHRPRRTIVPPLLDAWSAYQSMMH